MARRAGHQDFHKNNAAHYRQYRTGSGRTAFIKKYWGKKADILELPESTPKGTISKGVIESDKQRSNLGSTNKLASMILSRPLSGPPR